MSLSTSAAFLALLTASTALAALPPYHERVRQLSEILKSRDVSAALEGRGVIESVTAIPDNRYEVRTKSCRLEVSVEHVVPPPGEPIQPGPAKWNLVVGTPECTP